MLPRAIIIDDEQQGIDSLRTLIDLFVPEIKVVQECVMAEEAVQLIENYMPEIVFLDINMPQMNGFQLLEKLKWREFDLIFTTAHEQYGLQALRNNAVDYLLKPIDRSDLRDAIERIIFKRQQNVRTFDCDLLLKEIQNENGNRILVNSKEGAEYVAVDDIISLESFGNYTQLSVSNNESILTPATLKEFETQLLRFKKFMRVHHSYIINLEKVKRYLKATEDVIMINDQKIPIAKSRKEKFVAWLGI
jgi:two-component system LytT family response regulator